MATRRSTGYVLLANGTLPSIRIGKSVRVPLDKLRQWIEEQQAKQTEVR
jgi:excisionase family DNA binding protein